MTLDDMTAPWRCYPKRIGSSLIPWHSLCTRNSSSVSHIASVMILTWTRSHSRFSFFFLYYHNFPTNILFVFPHNQNWLWIDAFISPIFMRCFPKTKALVDACSKCVFCLLSRDSLFNNETRVTARDTLWCAQPWPEASGRMQKAHKSEILHLHVWQNLRI